MHKSVYKNCSTSYAPKISKYQNTNSKYFLCRYTQNLKILTQVPHCADAPDRAAHQRLLRLRPRCLGQRRRLWSHKVFLFNCFVFLFACLDLFRRSSGFVMKFASTILHWNTISPQGAEDRRGEVLGPCQLEKDQHERLPRGDEADKKVSRSCFTKNDNDHPSGRCRRTAWCRTRPGTRSLGRAPPRSNLICYAFVTLYIYIASQASLSLFI